MEPIPYYPCSGFSGKQPLGYNKGSKKLLDKALFAEWQRSETNKVIYHTNMYDTSETPRRHMQLDRGQWEDRHHK